MSHGGIGLIIGRLMSVALGKSAEQKYQDQSRGENDADFTKPHVTSSVKKNLPQDVDPKDIAMIVSLKISNANEDRNAELEADVLEQLKKNLATLGFLTSTSEKSAKLIFRVEIEDLSEGDRLGRFFRCDTGFVNLGMSFTLTDPTMDGKPIIKHGKIVYVDPLKDRPYKERCGKGSGKAAILGVLPEIAQLLSGQPKKADRF